MMTAQQSRLLDVLSGQKDGVCPSYEDLKNLMGLKSKSGIHRMLVGLEERGFIRRLPNRARAIEVIRRPVSETVAPVDTVRVVDVKDPDAYGDAMRALAAMARRNGIALTFTAVTSPIE